MRYKLIILSIVLYKQLVRLSSDWLGLPGLEIRVSVATQHRFWTSLDFHMLLKINSICFLSVGNMKVHQKMQDSCT